MAEAVAKVNMALTAEASDVFSKDLCMRGKFFTASKTKVAPPALKKVLLQAADCSNEHTATIVNSRGEGSMCSWNTASRNLQIFAPF